MDAPPHLPDPAPGRLQRVRPIAIIDIGSNSVRLVIYEGHSRAPTPLYNEKLLCGLGKGVATTGRLPEDAVHRALEALARFRLLCQIADVRWVRVLATAAARDAENGPAFLEAARRACGHEVELLSGEREAMLSAFGVISSFYEPDGLVGDLGGGSLELIDVAQGRAGSGITRPLGGLVLSDLAGGSPKKAAKITRELLAGAPQLAALPGRTFYAVGGTFRALAKLQMAERGYPMRVLHGYDLDLSEGLQALAARASATKQDGVSEQRRPLLVYGAIVLDEIIRVGRPQRITISALGVREGLLYGELDPATRVEDPLLVAAAEFNILRSRAPRHGYDLIAWTNAAIERLEIAETAGEKRLRHAACLLADIGWRAHPDYRSDQSLALISQSSLLAIDHPGRAFLALAVHYRYAGLSADKVPADTFGMATPRLRELARRLGALLRVAYPVSIAMPGLLRGTSLGLEDGSVVLRLPAELAPLASERLAGRLGALAKLLRRASRIEIGGVSR
ncbi:Ppx/GppA phosphatase family protein [Enterovirga sp.]|uniref:Ppx/GppA family phosphatase n=1 Tax=Enterovirga sp. TaxID=2026350 RepID=UPI002604A3F2|nr:Ppx/GppA phosphatase family protein [Enterovirga sp.]MDB5591720.1 ppx [Enterovirga sp.]